MDMAERYVVSRHPLSKSLFDVLLCLLLKFFLETMLVIFEYGGHLVSSCFRSSLCCTATGFPNCQSGGLESDTILQSLPLVELYWYERH